jgi:hypothetical protein
VPAGLTGEQMPYPVSALTLPKAGPNASLDRILVGMHDTGTGLHPGSFGVTADFAIDGVAAGEELAKQFKPLSTGAWELRLVTPVTALTKGTLTVSVKDNAGKCHADRAGVLGQVGRGSPAGFPDLVLVRERSPGPS